MSPRRIIGYGIIAILLASGTLALWQRESLAAWYRTWKLQHASVEALPGLVRQFETMGTTGTSSLINVFRSKDHSACQKAGYVLGKVLSIWGPDDIRLATVFQQLTSAAPTFSKSGFIECLAVMQAISLSQSTAKEKVSFLAVMAAQAPDLGESRVTLYEAFNQAIQTLDPIEDDARRQAKSLVVIGIKHPQESVRIAAIRLAVLPCLQLHEHLTPLVTAGSTDASAEVRQLALLALGEHEKLLSTEELCYFLNDPNKEVCTIADKALRIRGLSQQQIKLAKLLHDKNPISRSEVPSLVLLTPEVDTFQWMERLSRDNDPAVRAATARALSKQTDERLQSLLKTLSENDRDVSVQQIARYYVGTDAKR